MSKTILFSVLGANDLNSFGDFQQNNLRSYVFYCLNSDIELPVGERDFNNALELGLKIDFPIVNHILDNGEENVECLLSDLSTIINIPPDDGRLAETIKKMDIDDSVEFYPDRASVPNTVERCVVLPEIGTEDWNQFKNGERHKFMLFRKKWSQWESGKYVYVWAIAIDVLGNKENQLETFDSENKSHFPIGLVVDQDLINILKDEKSHLFDFSFDLMSTTGVEPEICNFLMVKNQEGISLGKSLQYSLPVIDKFSVLFSLSNIDIDTEKYEVFSMYNGDVKSLAVAIETDKLTLKLTDNEFIYNIDLDLMQSHYFGFCFGSKIHLLIDSVVVNSFDYEWQQINLDTLVFNENDRGDYGFIRYLLVLNTAKPGTMKPIVRMLRRNDVSFLDFKKSGNLYGLEDNLFTVLSKQINEVQRIENFETDLEVPLWER